MLFAPLLSTSTATVVTTKAGSQPRASNGFSPSNTNSTSSGGSTPQLAAAVAMQPVVPMSGGVLRVDQRPELLINRFPANTLELANHMMSLRQCISQMPEQQQAPYRERYQELKEIAKKVIQEFKHLARTSSTDIKEVSRLAFSGDQEVCRELLSPVIESLGKVSPTIEDYDALTLVLRWTSGNNRLNPEGGVTTQNLTDILDQLERRMQQLNVTTADLATGNAIVRCLTQVAETARNIEGKGTQPINKVQELLTHVQRLNSDNPERKALLMVAHQAAVRMTTQEEVGKLRAMQAVEGIAKLGVGIAVAFFTGEYGNLLGALVSIKDMAGGPSMTEKPYYEFLRVMRGMLQASPEKLNAEIAKMKDHTQTSESNGRVFARRIIAKTNGWGADAQKEFLQCVAALLIESAQKDTRPGMREIALDAYLSVFERMKELDPEGCCCWSSHPGAFGFGEQVEINNGFEPSMILESVRDAMVAQERARNTEDVVVGTSHTVHRVEGKVNEQAALLQMLAVQAQQAIPPIPGLKESNDGTGTWLIDEYMRDMDAHLALLRERGADSTDARTRYKDTLERYKRVKCRDDWTNVPSQILKKHTQISRTLRK